MKVYVVVPHPVHPSGITGRLPVESMADQQAVSQPLVVGKRRPIVLGTQRTWDNKRPRGRMARSGIIGGALAALVIAGAGVAAALVWRPAIAAIDAFVVACTRLTTRKETGKRRRPGRGVRPGRLSHPLPRARRGPRGRWRLERSRWSRGGVLQRPRPRSSRGVTGRRWAPPGDERDRDRAVQRPRR